eukprot:CAMPEP_0204288214 /NCGR_PEP_ID=MMETSP0468-20130131/56318_1 /ASSEMBLY_ACC=CAM_ASM_000383 /TAXON_ID=2969 /ORGANISM="Oxyrrhis marina" /LENGTH=95 /DNA_ID=CAMNT_0051266289 /DNA_START=70 /DNA_END=354 /DNA_ORIENTATION=-
MVSCPVKAPCLQMSSCRPSMMSGVGLAGPQVVQLILLGLDLVLEAVPLLRRHLPQIPQEEQWFGALQYPADVRGCAHRALDVEQGLVRDRDPKIL